MIPFTKDDQNTIIVTDSLCFYQILFSVVILINKGIQWFIISENTKRKNNFSVTIGECTALSTLVLFLSQTILI